MGCTRPSLMLLALVVCGAVPCLASGRGQGPGVSPRRRPDVFLITVDTLRADHLQCYGYGRIQTPGIDGLANDGALFASAFTPTPLTTPSHVSILTGYLPRNHGVTDFGVPLSRSRSSMAQLLKAAGYQTAAFIGSVMLDSNRFAPGLNRGFDFYDNFPTTQPQRHQQPLERRAGVVVSRVEHWLAVHSTGPRFVWMHLYDPHEPYAPPPPYADAYKTQPYDGEIAYADSAVRQLLTRLQRRNQYDGALIILVGDHGESLGEHGEKAHGVFLYDATVHVPLILKLPSRQRAGTVINRQVRTVDILPTVMDLLSIRQKARMDGVSLRTLILAGDGEERPVFGETDYPLHFGWSPLRSIREHGFKFIEAPRPELYNLDRDPKELHNIFGTRTATASALREKLAAQPVVDVVKRTRRMDQPSIEQLRALGYLPSDSGADVAQPPLLPDAKDNIQNQQ